MSTNGTWMYIYEQYLTKDQTDAIKEMNSILSRVGCEIRLEAAKEGTPPILLLNYDKEKAEKVITRGAGRKLNCSIDIWSMTVGELRERIKQSNHSKVASELGINRSTLYRKLKKDDNEYIC